MSGIGECGLDCALVDVLVIGNPVAGTGKAGRRAERLVRLLSENDELRELHNQLVELAGKIFDQMRKDLYITSKSVWNK